MNATVLLASAALARDPGTRRAASSAAPAAARAALRADVRLASAALWSDHVPADAARLIAGPAHTALAAQAALRWREGLRVRVRFSRLAISSIRRLGHGELLVQALLVQELVPTALDGKPLGAALRLDEAASIVLRRQAGGRLVVWSLKPR